MLGCFKKRKPVAAQPVKIKANYPEEHLELALMITGSFEGSGFANVAGNFDKQGISVGILQWNYGQGSLQRKILLPLIEKLGTAKIDRLFPKPICLTAYMSEKKAIKYAKKHMLRGKYLKSEWREAWRNFLSDPEVIGQQKIAADSIASKAWGYCEKYNMDSKKSFCFFFDIVTQNGSLKGINKPTDFSVYAELRDADSGKNLKAWQDAYLDVDIETATLFVWASRRVTRNKWAQDVMDRKGTIAHGLGTVHGKYYNFANNFK